MEKDFVSEEVCAERHKNADEKFEGIQADIKEQEERQRKIESLNIQMGEILKNHNEKIENHEQRISAVEARPMKFWDKLQWLVLGALTSGLISVIIQSFTK